MTTEQQQVDNLRAAFFASCGGFEGLTETAREMTLATIEWRHAYELAIGGVRLDRDSRLSVPGCWMYRLARLVGMPADDALAWMEQFPYAFQSSNFGR